MNYLLILALHVCAVLIWTISMLATSVAMAAFADGGPAGGGSTVISWLRRWDRYVTMPAMILAWILGITLVVEGGWFGAMWLTVKLVLVIALSALHGMQAKTLRRLETRSGTAVPLPIRLSPIIIVLCGMTIVWLVVTKPFY